MTVSYTPAQNPQEPEPQRSNVQQSQAIAGQPGEPVENAQQLSALIRRKVVTKTQENSPGKLAGLEIENGNIILHRRPNFFLRTVYRPEHKPNPLRNPDGHSAVMPKVMPHQERRIEVSETRMMPKVTLHTTQRTRAIPVPAWLEAVIVVLGLVGTFVAHAYNMFNFPRYELDEGTYMSNAWAITQGLISPYPYGYGHPPLAWMQIAAWVKLTGGFFTFGNALNSGRVLMLLYAVGSALLVYLIVRLMSGSLSAALLALVIFSFSPLSITYQRQVFLDNVATFWLLLSIYWLAVSNSRMLYIVLAAIAFGFSVLSKEVYLVCLPVIIYAAWLHTTKFQRKFTLVSFIYGVIAICSGFVLMAILKGELLPYSWHLPWDTHPHLSLLDTLLGQAERGEVGGSFLYSWNTWLDNDRAFIICSLAAPLFNLLYGLWNRKHLLLSLPPFRFLNRRLRIAAPVPERHLLLSLLAISFWLVLVRGGQVLSFYIIPLIPLVALNTAVALNTILGWLGKLVRFDVVRALLLVIAIAVILPYDIKATGFRFYQHPTSAQEQALVWVRNNVPHNAFVVINSYLYLDLRVPGGQGIGDGAPYPHAEVYWNVAFDPELYQQALQSNWDRIDYIVADSEMLHDIQTYGGPMNIIKDAYDHSVPRAEFRANDHDLQIVVGVYQVIHKIPLPNVYSAPGSGTG
jgi:4-amino-4-deoxy-L-arabinose transferase-like glycosyltransferase